jgi:hypothetical protein
MTMVDQNFWHLRIEETKEGVGAKRRSFAGIVIKGANESSLS